MKKLISIIACLILLISTDTLGQWEEVNNGIDGGNISSFISIDNTLFVSHKGKGIYCSTNNGNTWIEKNKGLESKSINYLKKRDKELFAIVSDKLIYTSSNFGENWELDSSISVSQFLIIKDLFFENGNLYLIANTPNDYVSRLFISIKKGLSWEELNIDKTINGYKVMTSSFIKKGNDLLLGAADGVYLSIDRGKTWQQRGYMTLNKHVTQIISNQEEILAGTLYNGIYFSKDSGLNWIQKSTGLPYSYSVKKILLFKNNIFLNIANNGIYLSSNNGYTWSLVSNSINDLDINALYIHENDLFIGTSVLGVFRAKLSDFGITDIKEDIKLLNSFTISPNPSQKNINIKFGNELNLDSKYFIYDLSGNILEESNFKIGTKSFPINIQNLTPGLYFIKINDETRSFIKW